MKFSLSLFAYLLSIYSIAQDKPAYKLYNSKGKQVKYSQMIDDIEAHDVLLFGELHNNTIAHWLELEVTKDLHERKELILGAEMIERDNQDELNAYLNDSIDYKALDTLARLWSNHETDYQPMVDFAKENSLYFVATNIPRRYARMVHKGDFNSLDSLESEELNWIAQLPIPFDSTLPTYQSIIEMMGDHGSMKLLKAQAIKDATMAESIYKELGSCELFVHYNGAFHSDYHEGIEWYLKQYSKDFQVITITTITQAEIGKLDKQHKGKADYIICVDEDVTATY